MSLLNQYANSVIDYSSQYGSFAWSASETLGKPDTTDYGDHITAWAPSAQDGTIETLTLGFATAVYATGVIIRESLGNGFVTKIEALSAADGSYSQVWTGRDTANPNEVSDFTISFSQTTFLVKGVRITIDTNHSNDWEEIDSVALIGDTTLTHHVPTPTGSHHG